MLGCAYSIGFQVTWWQITWGSYLTQRPFNYMFFFRTKTENPTSLIPKTQHKPSKAAHTAMPKDLRSWHQSFILIWKEYCLWGMRFERERHTCKAELQRAAGDTVITSNLNSLLFTNLSCWQSQWLSVWWLRNKQSPIHLIDVPVTDETSNAIIQIPKWDKLL